MFILHYFFFAFAYFNHCSFKQIILDAVEQVGGIYLVTADHGNAEDMVKRNKAGKPLLDKSGGIQILTSHTLQPVSPMPQDPRPFIVSLPARGSRWLPRFLMPLLYLQVPVAIGGPGLHPGVKFRNDIQTPGLANVAATVMNLHGFEAPADYEPTLIEVAHN